MSELAVVTDEFPSITSEAGEEVYSVVDGASEVGHAALVQADPLPSLRKLQINNSVCANAPEATCTPEMGCIKAARGGEPC